MISSRSALKVLTGFICGAALLFPTTHNQASAVEPAPTRAELAEQGYGRLLPHGSFNIGFMHERGGNPDHITMFITAPVPLQGCANVMPYEVNQHYEGNVLILKIEHPIVLLPAEQRGRHNCNQVSNTGSSFTLNRAEIMDKGIREIRMRTQYGVTSFNLELNEHMIRLTPKNNQTRPPIEYWSLPDNAIVLNIPMARGDIRNNPVMFERLIRVASARGLTPIETRFPDYKPARENINRFVFLESGEIIRDAISNAGDSIILGQVFTSEPFYGAHGSFDKEIALDIIAMMPTQFD
ncbi:MAG: hypothetical protein ACK4VI_08100 [Alphaproteobacteria bacterium]